MEGTEYIVGINWYLRISDTVGEVSHKLVIINGFNCNCGKYGYKFIYSHK